MSKWVVSILFASVVLLRHDGTALWGIIGSVSNSALSLVLKCMLNQARPATTSRSDPGMPFTHAQSISFISVFAVLSVTRIEATSHNLDMFMHLDVNSEVYPMAVGDKFTLAMAPIRSHELEQRREQRKRLLISTNALYYYREQRKRLRDGQTPKAEMYVSFGGLLMLLRGDPAHISHFELDQRLPSHEEAVRIFHCMIIFISEKTE